MPPTFLAGLWSGHGAYADDRPCDVALGGSRAPGHAVAYASFVRKESRTSLLPAFRGPWCRVRRVGLCYALSVAGISATSLPCMQARSAVP